MKLYLPMSFCFAFGAAACGDEPPAKPDPDAAVVVIPDAPPDAQVLPECETDCAEGGEVRLEYLEFPANDPVRVDRTRATAFFFGGASSQHMLPNIPGCTDMTGTAATTRWPLAQDTGRQYLDVGRVIISPSTASTARALEITKRVMGQGTTTTSTADDYYGSDFLDRQYLGGTWYFTGNSGSPSTPQALGTGQGGFNNVGRTYVTDDTKYDVTITGSASFPATVFEDVLYMPNRFPLIDPPQGDYNATGGSTAAYSLTAGAKTITYTVPTNTNVPAGETVDTLIAFTKGNPPVILCIEEGIDGSITIPANMVDIVRTTNNSGGAVTSGEANRFLRQHVVHQTRTSPDPVNRKRIDFLSVWCYNYPLWTP
jgi:hypothetical protein